MKLGWDLKRGLNRRLSSWNNSFDSCDGDLITYGIEFDEQHHTYPQLIVRVGSAILYRQGMWDAISSNQNSSYEFVQNDDEVYYSLKNKSMVSILVLQDDGSVSRWEGSTEDREQWSISATTPVDQCDSYGFCGANSQCVLSIKHGPMCQCLEGFKPKNQEEWNPDNPQEWNPESWSEGCESLYSLASCHEEEKEEFHEYVGLRVPDTKNSWLSKANNGSECKSKCSSNCSCMAYSFIYSESNVSVVLENTNCVLWFGDLFDIRQLPSGDGGGQNTHIRIPSSKIESRTDPNREEKAKEKAKVRVKRVVMIISIIMGLGGGILLIAFYICRKTHIFERNKSQDDDLELPFFELHTISTATDNFSEANKLGEGGFGPVYKGTMEGGQEIAVKRLSMCSGQGANEFKNEIKLIAKLQHRNLVKIFGYCIHREMKLLIYEYMSNKSLDYFIFDERQSILLDWSKRYKIVCGIAKGLLYLHHDSRLRIIHRDLKASNVLLDEEMNPKISDFGLARTFGGDQIEGNTNKVVGTYGYMAPEYASHGRFSIKSDVFSFGILVLEIVSGKKSRGLYDEDNILNLTGLAWTLMKEGNAFKLIEKFLLSDPHINMEEALRCIHIGLLCVQQKPFDRPNMSSVVLMLGDKSILPQPKPPAYFTNTDLWEGAHSPALRPPSCNTSITTVEGR
ncbi:hypothetical protein CsatA_005822 [Cannabis sativa]